ncbi:MAG: hypothetical protein KJP06_01910 [Deltaproteobacteria bacterium]|nr:hypothetical protein [Deltaproteobacteria bacterium]
MPRKKGKSVSFDAMVKFFMHNYEIPTKKDVDKLNARLDRIEKMLNAIQAGHVNTGRSAGKFTRGRTGVTAFEQVYQVIKDYKQGVGIAEIKLRTGFDDKKIRNIIFRLNKIGNIKRKSRGIYIAK